MSSMTYLQQHIIGRSHSTTMINDDNPDLVGLIDLIDITTTHQLTSSQSFRSTPEGIEVAVSRKQQEYKYKGSIEHLIPFLLYIMQ